MKVGPRGSKPLDDWLPVLMVVYSENLVNLQKQIKNILYQYVNHDRNISWRTNPGTSDLNLESSSGSTQFPSSSTGSTLGIPLSFVFAGIKFEDPCSSLSSCICLAILSWQKSFQLSNSSAIGLLWILRKLSESRFEIVCSLQQYYQNWR